MVLRKRLSSPVTHILLGDRAYKCTLSKKTVRGGACYVYTAFVNKAGTYDFIGLSTDGKTAAICEYVSITILSSRYVDVTLIVEGNFYGSENAIADWYAGYEIDNSKLYLVATESAFSRDTMPVLNTSTNKSCVTVGDSLRIRARIPLSESIRGFVAVYDSTPCAYFPFSISRAGGEVSLRVGYKRMGFTSEYTLVAEGALINPGVTKDSVTYGSVAVSDVKKLECNSSCVAVLSGSTLKLYSPTLELLYSRNSVSDFSLCEHYLVIALNSRRVILLTADKTERTLAVTSSTVIAAEFDGLVLSTESNLYKYDELLGRVSFIRAKGTNSVCRVGGFLMEYSDGAINAISRYDEVYPGKSLEGFTKVSETLGFDGTTATDLLSGVKFAVDDIGGGLTRVGNTLYVLDGGGAARVAECASVPSLFARKGGVVAYVEGGNLFVGTATLSTYVDISVSEAQYAYAYKSTQVNTGTHFVSVLI